MCETYRYGNNACMLTLYIEWWTKKRKAIEGLRVGVYYKHTHSTQVCELTGVSAKGDRDRKYTNKVVIVLMRLKYKFLYYRPHIHIYKPTTCLFYIYSLRGNFKPLHANKNRRRHGRDFE